MHMFNGNVEKLLRKEVEVCARFSIHTTSALCFQNKSVLTVLALLSFWKSSDYASSQRYQHCYARSESMQESWLGNNLNPRDKEKMMPHPPYQDDIHVHHRGRQISPLFSVASLKRNHCPCSIEKFINKRNARLLRVHWAHDFRCTGMVY